MNDTVRQGVYEHYKGKKYEVTTTARLEATLEPVVVYRALYSSEDFGDGAVWVRSVADFLSMVDVDGVVIPRFKYIGEQ